LKFASVSWIDQRCNIHKYITQLNSRSKVKIALARKNSTWCIDDALIDQGYCHAAMVFTCLGTAGGCLGISTFACTCRCRFFFDHPNLMGSQLRHAWVPPEPPKFRSRACRRSSDSRNQ
jgi:hypothetical protein